MATTALATTPETYSYGPHDLQKVHVYNVQQKEPGLSTKSSNQGYWVIYIHGGGWRDPRVLAESFGPTETFLQSQHASLIREHTIAFASIDYRLSAHPNFLQDRNTTDAATQLRNAKHPDHLHDVQAAITFLQGRYDFGDRYILVGHSCGATLAFQIVMGKVAGAAPTTTLPKPRAVVGVCGIYDLRLLRDDFSKEPIYQQFIEGAFGPDEDLWDRVSPAKVSDPDDEGLEAGWPNGKLALLAHSAGDELVNLSQFLAMKDVLERWKAAAAAKDNRTRQVVLLQDLQEPHDDVWGNGKELATVIATAVRELVKIDS
ncbi:hypothetical protein VTN77DRAFT_4479 [Rasamsonia byssochlamydoides]|uniref:uncharacterized protein n=1 Tax=Rasamsonia byssochlamydoides TaxID=89139 RepID=UPI003742FB53